MKRQSLADWWDAQPDAQTCSGCGKTGSKAYVQPQRDRGGALCLDCMNAAHRKYREERKAQLAALPRCQVPGCKARGTWNAGSADGPVLMCGRHLKAAQREFQRKYAGPIWLPSPTPSAETLLKMATTT